MKVLFLNYYSQCYGGAETYWHETTKGLADYGVNVLKLSLTKGDQKLLINTINDFWPDVIHLNKSDLFLKLIKSKFNIPTVVTVHDYYTIPFPVTIKNNVKSIIRDHAFLADKYIIPASHYFHSLNKKNIPDIHFIPHFIDTNKWVFNLNNYCAKNKILFVGRLEKLKGIDVLIKAAKILRRRNNSVHLTIIGEGNEKESIQKKIIAEGLSKNINIVGPKSHRDILKIFHASTLLVVPTVKNELFGLVGLEAQASGLPVLASDLPGIREWCLHGKTGMTVRPNDPHALALNIEFLLENPELREKLRYNGRKYAEVTFTKQKSIRELTFLYQRLIKHDQPSTAEKIPSTQRESL
ncbi:MAG: glycosyltransferase family 4 protein [Bacteroidota bacterium]